ncbi:MAG: class I SAM-dependent methyltransferase [Acidimicrobiales bacterium]
MGFYEEQVLPRAIDLMLGNAAMGKLRARALEGVSGEVLEVGFGSGTNLEHYPAEVTKVLAVDPATVGRKLARKRLAAARVPVEFVGLDGQTLPLPDESVDNAVSTWTLCTIPDVAAALAEIRRVLRPGGRLYFLEHGLSDDPRIARRQHRLDGLQQRIAGGCHLDRRHDDLIRDAGFDLDHVATFTIAGPKVSGFMYAGSAARD